MLNINILDSEIGKYIESKKLNVEDVSSVELGITTNDLQFVNVDRIKDYNSDDWLLSIQREMSTKEGFNQYAVTMKELNRKMVDACSDYAGITEFLGVKTEDEIKKLSKEQILQGAAYIQFLESVKKQITYKFATHMYFCCLPEGNAMKKECMFSLKKSGKGLDYELMYDNQVELLKDNQGTTCWEKWIPEKRTFIGYVSDNLMRSHAVNLGKENNKAKGVLSYHSQAKRDDGEKSTTDMVQVLSFEKYRNDSADEQSRDESKRFLEKLREKCFTKEEFNIFEALDEYESLGKSKKATISRADYINKRLGTNYAQKKLDDKISGARRKVKDKIKQVETFKDIQKLVKDINSELGKNYSYDEFSDKLIRVKKEVTKREKQVGGKSKLEIQLDALNYILGTNYMTDSYNEKLISVIEKGSIPKLDEEFMELFSSYMKDQEIRANRSEKFEAMKREKYKQKERSVEYLVENSDKMTRRFYAYLKEHEKLAVSNFIQSFTEENTRYQRFNYLWKFINKLMIEKHQDEAINALTDYKNAIELRGERSEVLESYLMDLSAGLDLDINLGEVLGAETWAYSMVL